MYNIHGIDIIMLVKCVICHQAPVCVSMLIVTATKHEISLSHKTPLRNNVHILQISSPPPLFRPVHLRIVLMVNYRLFLQLVIVRQ